MIIGASLGSFRGLTLEEGLQCYLKILRNFDVKVVELRFEKEASRPSMWPWESNGRLADFLSKFEVTGAHLPFIYLNPISQNPGIQVESIDQLKIALDRASLLNMTYAVMHAHGSAYGLTHARQLNEWERVIKELADYAESRSILLTVENCDFLGNLKELAALVRKINSKWLKITLDVGHAHIRRISQTESGSHLFPYSLRGLMMKAMDMTFAPFLFKRYMPYEEYGSVKRFLQSEHDLIFNLHIHDYNGRKDHIALGSGKIDFSFMKLFEKSNIPLILESRFENHYGDFTKNYQRLKRLIKEG